MTPLSTADIHVRRRPGAIALVWLARLASAFFVAYPLAQAMGRTGAARFPEGDALLFEPGAYHLIETVRVGGEPLHALMRSAIVLAVVVTFLQLVPLTALMTALSREGRLRLNAWAALTAEALPTFIFLAGLTVLGQAIVAIFVATLLAKAAAPLRAVLDASTAGWILLGGAILGALTLLVLSILHDLARAACIRHGAGGGPALSTALATGLSRPLAVVWGWFTPAAWGVAVVLLAAAVTNELAVHRTGQWRVYSVFVVHQAAVLGLVAFRALWLTRALRLVELPFEPAGGRLGDSDAPVGPSPDPGS